MPPIDRQPKITAIQLLRALAALTVAYAHFAGSFGRHIDHRLDSIGFASHAAQCAVALFFVISGCVMVLSSRNLFGHAAGNVVFWRRRVVRVIPPYWIATLLLVVTSIGLGLPVEAGEVARSVLFVPYRNPAEEGMFLPFLWPGWTLIYELTFYAIFGCFVFAGKSWTIALTSLALVILTCVGFFGAPQSIAAITFTRPVLLLFIVGMTFGLAIERGFAIPHWMRIIIGLLGVAAFFALGEPKSGLPDLTYLTGAGIPAILLFVAVLGGPLRIPLERATLLGGDASYAIYLLHAPLAQAWMLVFNNWLHHPGGSITYVVTGLILLVIVSIAFHRHVEVPMTARLNALLGGARRT